MPSPFVAGVRLALHRDPGTLCQAGMSLHRLIVKLAVA